MAPLRSTRSEARGPTPFSPDARPHTSTAVLGRFGMALLVIGCLVSGGRGVVAEGLRARLDPGRADVPGALPPVHPGRPGDDVPWGPNSSLYQATYGSGCPPLQVREAGVCTAIEVWLAGKGYTSTCVVDASGGGDATTISGCGYASGQATIVRSGTYREDVRPASGRFALVAYPGERPIVSGADVVAPGGWVDQGGGVWRHPWVWEAQDNGNGQLSPGRRREVFVVGGLMLGSLGGATLPIVPDGRFWVDGPPSAPRAVYMNPPGQTDPNAAVVEVGQRWKLFWPRDADGQRCRESSESGYLVAGMTFRHGTSNRQLFALCLGASDGTLLDSDVSWQNGGAVNLSGSNHVVVGNRLNNNGIEGPGGTGANGALLAFNEVRWNGWEDPTGGGHGGGGKFTRTRGLVVRNNVYADNYINGLWLDTNNRNVVVAANLFQRNENTGVFLELFSDSTLVANNLCVENRVRPHAASGPTRLAGCIKLTDSNGVVVAFNTIVNASNAAISMFADDRSLWPCGHDGHPGCGPNESAHGVNPYGPDRDGSPHRSHGSFFLNNLLMVRYISPYTNAAGQRVAPRASAIRVGAAGGDDEASHTWGGNLVWDQGLTGSSREAYSTQSAGVETNSYEVWSAATGERGGGTFANPLAVLVDTASVAGMVHLAASSPARSNGVPVPAAVYDLFEEGRTRDAARYHLTHDAWGHPRKEVPDVGAAEAE